MKNKSIYFGIAILLVSATLACSFGFLGGPQLPPDILFQDNFSDSTSGWDRIESEEFATDYKNDVYEIQVKDDSTMAWANPGLDFFDVIVETDAIKIAGTDDNSLGIICRYSETEDASNFYFFVISSDGFYGIGKVIDGQQEMISSENMEYSEMIQPGEISNHLQADCVGNQLVLNVNGHKLANATDEALPSGDVGLIAGAFSPPGTDILFDNFVVKKP